MGSLKELPLLRVIMIQRMKIKQIMKVDAIAGATITGDGVTAMIKSELRLYVPYFENLKMN